MMKNAIPWKSGGGHIPTSLTVTCLLFNVAIEFVFNSGLKYKLTYLNKDIFKP